MPPRPRLTLLQKGIALIAAPLLYQAILLGTLFHQQQLHTEAQQRVVHTKDVLLSLDEISVLLLSSQGDLRLYLLVSNPEFKERVLRREGEMREKLAGVEALVETPLQRERVRVIKERVERRLAYNRELVVQIDSGDREGAIERVRRLEGQQLMEAIQSELRATRKTEETADDERLAELRRTSKLQNALLTGGLVLNVLLGAGVVLFFSWKVSSRLSLLAANIARVGRGEKLLPVVPNEDEIGTLDRGLHEMAESLREAQQSEREVAHTLHKRNLELNRANRDLDEKNQENEMFVYSVSHDLRSPLVNLQGFSKELGLARDDLRTLFNGNIGADERSRGKTLIERDVSESIHYIQTAVTRLSSIIDALLRLSRAGRVEYLPEMVELREVVQRIVESMQATIEQRGARVTVHDLPPAWGDPTAMEQIFANIIGNAVNYLDPVRPGQLEIGALAVPPEELVNNQVYYVRDNGLGIADAYLPKVFTIFQRLHANAAPGEGVGLALVRRTVERHGGKIWVESKEGEGSTFFVAFPIKEKSPLVVAPKKERIRLGNPPNS